MEKECWEPVSKECWVLVSREHRFNTDTILLAAFSKPKPLERCADIGTGCGMIPLLWKVRGAKGMLYGVELQEDAVFQARRTMERNGFSESVHILHQDARCLREVFSAGQLDLAVCNPPYKAPGSGLVNEDAGLRRARHEETLTLLELAKNVSYALRFGGRFCLCLRPERLAEAMAVLRENGLEPKRLRLVQQRRSKPPSLFLLECRRGGRSGLSVEPTLFLEDENGLPSQELEEIYGDYRENQGWKK